MSLRTADEIVQRYGTLKADRANWEVMWQEISDEVTGRRDYTVKELAGRKRMPVIYDNTGLQSGDMLAAGLHNFLTNTATKWFDIRPEEDEVESDTEAAVWFADTQSRMSNVFNRAPTRFVPQTHEFYLDLVFFNTAIMFVEDVPGLPVRFSTRPLSEIFVSEDASGAVDTVFRLYELTHRQAMQQFGDQAPKTARERHDKNPEAKTEYIHLVHRRGDPQPGRLDSTGMPWRSVHVSLADKEILTESGFWEMPYLVARWEKDSGEMYGRGPGVNALSECKMTNLMSKTLIKAAQKITDPPLMVADDGVVNPVNTSPGGLNVTRSSSFLQDPIRPLPIEPNLPIGVEMLERRRAQIRTTFLHDFLQLNQDPRMTATQVLEIAEKAQALIAPVLGRLQSEFLSPLIERVYAVMVRRRMFAEPPEFLQGAPIRIDYISPVQRAQMAGEVRSIVNTLEIVAPLSELNPEIMDNVDLDEAARQIIRHNGADPAIQRSLREVAALRQSRAQAQAEAQQRENIATASQALPGLAAALRPGGG